jgi:hypothetical protein
MVCLIEMMDRYGLNMDLIMRVFSSTRVQVRLLPIMARFLEIS